MSNNWIYLSLIIITGVSALPQFDRDKGESSFALLKLNQSPRTIAMSGAGAALAGSSMEACDVNPAAAYSDSGTFYIGHGIPFQEFRAAVPNITWGIPLGNKRIFINSRFLKFEEIKSYDEDNKPLTPFGAHTLKAQAGYADIFRTVHWGVSFGYALNSITAVNYQTFFIDAGIRYQIISNFWAGASITNADVWTSSARTSGGSEPFTPATLRAGLAYTRKINDFISAGAALDARTRNDETLTFPAGIEIELLNILYLRTGYPLGEPEPAFSFGTGLIWGNFILDYAFQRHETLTAGHFMSLGIRF